jgi:hypothetical protein
MAARQPRVAGRRPPFLQLLLGCAAARACSSSTIVIRGSGVGFQPRPRALSLARVPLLLPLPPPAARPPVVAGAAAAVLLLLVVVCVAAAACTAAALGAATAAAALLLLLLL